MTQSRTLTAALLLSAALLFTACAAAEQPEPEYVEPPVASAESLVEEQVEPEPPEEPDREESTTEPELEPDEPESAPEPEPQPHEPPPAPANLPVPEEGTVVFHIQDKYGNPVDAVQVTGVTELGEDGRFVSGWTLHWGSDQVDIHGNVIWKDESGYSMYPPRPGSYTLFLESVYDMDVFQVTDVIVTAVPSVVTVTWEHPRPADVRPEQTTGLRILVVDTEENPVPDFIMAGSPYSLEAQEEMLREWDGVPEIGIMIGPSDINGIIRWEELEPGTFELGGSPRFHEGTGSTYTLVMPEGKAMEEITIVWDETQSEDIGG